MIDILNEFNAVRREVGSRPIPAGEARTVVLRRGYDSPIEDVWDAITNPDRVSRWFLPVTGDFRPGGTYQLKGNAGGEILRCEPPNLLAVTWMFGDPTAVAFSEVEVRLSIDAGETVLELQHTALDDPERWATYGPGAVGVGWDLTLLGLSLHLRGGEIAEEERDAWGQSPEARRFMTQSSDAWGAALRAAGASEAEAATAVENTTRFYVPPIA